VQTVTAGARERLHRIGGALPEAKVTGDQHLRFAIRGRTFAWLLEDHHGDGRLAVNCKAAAGRAAGLAAADPERYALAPYLGARGWVAAWLDVDEIDWPFVEELVRDSYRLIAPKTLAREV
jgi:predicted DNA-binding protein (MmcQ/YjbR family)